MLCPLFLVSISTPFLKLFQLNATHPPDHSHLCRLRCHLIFFFTCKVSLPCNTLLRTQLLYSFPFLINDVSLLVSNNCLNLFHPTWILASHGNVTLSSRDMPSMTITTNNGLSACCPLIVLTRGRHGDNHNRHYGELDIRRRSTQFYNPMNNKTIDYDTVQSKVSSRLTAAAHMHRQRRC